MTSSQSSENYRKEIVVLGAGVYNGAIPGLGLILWFSWIGVIGLTTAIVLQEKGDYRVTIVADIFPGDERNSRYTSNWAVSPLLHWPL
jgi:hypothetical protein